MRTVAIVPARGGSTRIPHKNVIDFMGKPLIAWTLEAARAAGIFHRIVVGTDDVRTAEIANRSGVETPFLRVEATDDAAPVSEATIATLHQARNHWKEDYDVVVQLMPNCPLRTAADIKRSYEHFCSSGADYQLSCFKYGWMNPWWAVALDEGGAPLPAFPGALRQRSQDLPTLYCPSGAVWIAKTARLLAERTFYGEGHRFYPIDWRVAVDIDEYDDLHFAKAVYSLSHRE